MCSLLAGGMCSRLKNAALGCHRRLSYSCAQRSSLSQFSCSLFVQHLTLRLSETRLELGGVRFFLRHKDAPVTHITRKEQDGIPKSYQLIYGLPSKMSLNMCYLGLVVMFIGGVGLAIKVYIFGETEAFTPVHRGKFDDQQLKNIDEQDLPWLFGSIFLGSFILFMLISRIPYRIYRSSVGSERQYVAVFLNRVMPFHLHNHPFQTASKLVSWAKILPGEPYRLGSRRAILFPSSFRSAYDHDELIDFQHGVSYFNVKKNNEDYDAAFHPTPKQKSNIKNSKNIK